MTKIHGLGTISQFGGDFLQGKTENLGGGTSVDILSIAKAC